MSERKTVTLGMVGAGFAGNFHCNAYAKVGAVSVRIKTVVDIVLERAKNLAEKWGIENYSDNYDDILGDPEIEAVDIVTIPSVHTQQAIAALKAGKHVICEKPLTGYFGRDGDPAPIGKTVPKSTMFEAVLRDVEEVRRAVRESGKQFMYAENYVYTPAIVRSAEMLRAKKSKILYMKGEESNRCSTSPTAVHWKYTGGGSLIRMGCHPLSGMLWLKQVEAEARGETIRPVSVVADVGTISPILTGRDKRHINYSPVDVEDYSTLTISFSDGSKALCLANDNTLGGVKNYVEIYASDSVLVSNITPANNLMTYFVDQEDLENVFISELLPEKTGWNGAFVMDEIMRGYVAECAEFAECIAENRPATAGIDIAADTIRIIYAAYVAAEEGRRVEL